MKHWFRFIDDLLLDPQPAPATKPKRSAHRGNLGFGSGLIILMFVMSFALFLYNCSYGSVFLNFAFGNVQQCVGLPGGAAGGTTGTISGLLDQLNSVFGSLGLLGIGSLIAFSVGFPNGYAIFAPVAFFLGLGALNIPVAIFTGGPGQALPNELRVFLLVLFLLLNGIATVEYLGAKRV